MSTLNFVLILHVCLIFITIQAENECGVNEKCVLLKHCPVQMKNMINGGAPKTCDFNGTEPMVCCAEKISSTTNITSTNGENKEKSERISRKKCVEYGESVYKSEKDPLLLYLLPEKEMETDKMSTCPGVHLILFVRGTRAEPKEYPHMALLGYKNEENKIDWHCSGVLISEQYILTTANCVLGKNTVSSDLKVRLGEIESNPTPKEDDYSTENIIIHPEYKHPAIYNDIALVKLTALVKFTEYIRPACLPKTNRVLIDKFIMTGWDYSLNNTLLRNQNLRQMSYEECETEFENNLRALMYGVSENSHICGMNSEQDLCMTYLGSPIQVFSDVFCMFDVIGLQAHKKSKNCSSQSVIFTRVFHYIDWIEKIVWP